MPHDEKPRASIEQDFAPINESEKITCDDESNHRCSFQSGNSDRRKSLLEEYRDGLEIIRDASLGWRRFYAAQLRMAVSQLVLLDVPRKEIDEVVSDAWEKTAVIYPPARKHR